MISKSLLQGRNKLTKKPQSRFKVEGIITALVTPFDDSGAIKEDALRKLIRFQLRKGIHGFFPCGTTGQGPLMTIDERKSVAEVVVHEAKHKVPVIVQVGAPDTNTAITLAKHAESIGAEAIGCVAPYYYQPDEDSLVRHYKKISEAVNLPVFVYNIPRHTGINIKPTTLLRLAKMNAIVGVKDSTRDFLQLVETIEILPKDFMVINGSEGYLLPALLMGAKGAVSALANALPEFFTELFSMFKKGDLEGAKTSQFRMNNVKRIAERGGLSSIYEILRERGIDCGGPRGPLRAMTNDERLQMLTSLKVLGAPFAPASV